MALDSSTLLSGIQSLAAQPHTHLSIKEPPPRIFELKDFACTIFPCFPFSSLAFEVSFFSHIFKS